MTSFESRLFTDAFTSLMMPWWTKEIWQRLKYTGGKGTSNWCGKKLGTDFLSYLQRDRGPSPMDLSCQGSKLRDDKWLVIRQLGLLMRRVGFLKMETRVGKTSADGNTDQKRASSTWWMRWVPGNPSQDDPGVHKWALSLGAHIYPPSTWEAEEGVGSVG